MQAKAATLDTDVTIAASQQLLSYAVLISAEGFWARTRMEPQPGRPSILPVVAAAGSMVAVRYTLSVSGRQMIHCFCCARVTQMACELPAGAPLPGCCAAHRKRLLREIGDQ